MKGMFKCLYLLLGLVNIIEGFSLLKGFSILFKQEIYVPFDMAYAYWGFIIYFIMINVMIVISIVFNIFKTIKVLLVLLTFTLIIFIYFSLGDIDYYKIIIIAIEIIIPYMYLKTNEYSRKC